MAWATGTATGPQDLYDKLVSFLKTNADLVSDNQEWTEAWALGGGSNDVVLEGPGQSGTDSVYIGIRLHEDAIGDAYWLEFRGMTGVIPSAISYSDHINTQPKPSKVFLDVDPMTYWFIANGRRFIVIVKITTIYEMAYCGFMLPYGTPGQYPYPMFVGGSAGEEESNIRSPKRWRDYVEGHSAYHWPVYYDDSFGYGNPYCYVLDPAGNWVVVGNTGYAAVVALGPGYSDGTVYTTYDTNENFYNAYETQRRLYDAFGGDKVVSPAILMRSQNGSQMLGALHGSYKCQGHLMGAEDEITIDGVDYLVIQNVFRTDLFDYCCVELS